MKKVLIIDDEPLARQIIISYLENRPELQLVGECADGFQGIKSINELEPDLIFLDIQMPKITGFEMLELITHQPHVVFTTAYDEYAIKAFEANAIDYLLKPFSKERFDKAVNKFLATDLIGEPKRTPTKSYDFIPLNRVVVKDGPEIKIIGLDDIYCFEAYDDYVKIHQEKGYILKKQTLTSLQKMLNNQHFVRIHRSFLININKLTRIENYEKNSYLAILTNDLRAPISRNSYAELKEILGV